MANILDKILAHKRDEIERAKSHTSQSQLVIRAEATEKPRNFFAAVTHENGPMIRAIAQVGNAKGADPVQLAQAFHGAGAAAICCPTDAQEKHRCTREEIEAIKSAVPIPVLRRDWIIDPYQLYESRVDGADAVTLTAECFHEAELIDMMILASQLQLTTLLEVHSTDALLKVRPYVGFPHAGYGLLAIHNRNLETGAADLNQTLRLIDMVEDTSILVSVSGIRTHEDAQKMIGAGARAVLIDEGLCDADDPGAALRAILQSG